MAEHERDDEIRRRYRELPREEPSRALDESILAAARRELEARPAPLVAPTGRRRWMFPLAAAAVIVLSAVITLHIQREQPDMELASAPPAEAPPIVAKEEKSRAKEVAPPVAERPKAEAPPVASSKPAPSPQPAQRAAPAAAAAPALRESMQGAPAALSRRAEATAAKRADSAEPPERMLERIAALRREGREKEADELYAEFRRRFPDYRIPDAMREQILPR